MPRFVGRYIAKHRRSAPLRYLARKCQNFLGYYENADWNFRSNGEQNLLKQLRPLDLATIIDVGANIGDWSFLAHEIFPQAHIYAFEIVASTAKTLTQRFSLLPTLHAQSFGLSDERGEVDILHLPAKTTVSSTLQRPRTQGDEPIILKGAVTTGDSFKADKNIKNIDFLKIDVEGTEHKVLKGFEKALRRQEIHIIQFEYGRNNIYSNFLLKDYYSYLEPVGYTIGKIFPTYIDFRDYSPWDENFQLSNYLAVRKERSDIIKLLV